jgi:hypothetical protein
MGPPEVFVMRQEWLTLMALSRLPGLVAQGVPERESTLFKKPCNRSVNPAGSSAFRYSRVCRYGACAWGAAVFRFTRTRRLIDEAIHQLGNPCPRHPRLIRDFGGAVVRRNERTQGDKHQNPFS